MSKLNIQQNPYYRNLGEYIEALDREGKLIRITEPINKDTELHPLVRLQFVGLKEEERKVFLFENIYDSQGKKYDIPVVVCAMAGSRQIYALGLKCELEEIAERWTKARANPISPIIVEDGPVQEVVITGEDLLQKGLHTLPVPISTPGFDNAPYTSSSHWISKDPESGIYNVGNYRGMIKSATRIGCFCGSMKQGLRIHVDKWKKQGEKRMPAAVVIGTPPSVSYTAVTRLPLDLSEYDISGGLTGVPLELVKCKTVDLLVPAHSEIVIEGYISLEELEMEGPFGEFPGYMARRDYSYFMEVTCITMRRKPIYQAFLSQFPPSESSKIRQIGYENAMRQYLLDQGINNVLDIHLVESSGSTGVTVVKIRRNHDDDGVKVLDALVKGRLIGKIGIVVDEDIDIHDPSAIYWAMTFRMQPHRDVRIIDAMLTGLDPSLADPREGRGNLSTLQEVRKTALLIDATRNWPYPPIALPKREFMDRAKEIWNQMGLSELDLKEPWFGYSLGNWTEKDEEEANMAVEGRYFETAEKYKNFNRKVFPDTKSE